jgi:carboxymethylenebutenolidase
MSTSRRSICAWSNRTAASAAGLAVLLAALAANLHGGDPRSPARTRPLPPFLESFKAAAETPAAVREVAVPSALGPVHGFLSRPATQEPLPAVLLLPDETGLTAWMKDNTRALSGIGYVVLALDLRDAPPGIAALADERTLAKTSAAVRWLRRRADVLPERIGVLGLGRGAEQALALAASTPLQACAVCEGLLRPEPALLAGLRGTPLLGVFAGQDARARQDLPAFRKALGAARIVHKIRVYGGVQKGFMPPASKTYAEHAAEEAWVEIYEFLGKYVEDVPAIVGSAAPPAARKAVATIADIMRAVNEPTGVRGTLIRLLEKEPADVKQWAQARARAALMAEAGSLLAHQTPPRGGPSDWLAQSQAYVAAAEEIVAATDRRDYGAARRGLQKLGARCLACHEQHR